MLATLSNPFPAATPARIRSAVNLVGQMARCQATSRLAELLLRALQPFGVDTYAMWAATNPERVDPLASMLSNWPEEWASIYRAERKYLYDPVVVEALKQPGNFFWRDIAVAPNSKAGELFKQARQYGMIDGFTMSSRAQWPVVTALSVSGRELPWDESDEGMASLVAHTFMSRSMYLRAAVVIPAVEDLDGQQRRILCLAAQGQGDKEIAQGLGIGNTTLTSRWERLRQKLGASDRAQAVAIGLWSGQLILA